MKEEIQLWKEFKDDQLERYNAMQIDPDFKEIFRLVPGESCIMAKLRFDLHYPLLKLKYGVVEETYENFLNWCAKDKPKFKGIEIKVKDA